MTVQRGDGAIRLIGDCPVEDADSLLALLIDNPEISVDVSASGRLHTAVAQVLLAARPEIVGQSSNIFAARWVMPHVLDVAAETTFTGTGRAKAPVESRTRRTDLE